MKKIFLLIVLSVVLYTTQSQAQGNLQYNATKWITQTTTSSTPTTMTITVPANKVWKIESVYVRNDFEMGTSSIILDGITLFRGDFTNKNNWIIPLPLFLPSGSYLLNFNPNGPNKLLLNAVEFNIVP